MNSSGLLLIIVYTVSMINLSISYPIGLLGDDTFTLNALKSEGKGVGKEEVDGGGYLDKWVILHRTKRQEVDVLEGATGTLANAGTSYGQALASNILSVVTSSLTGNINGIITNSVDIFRNQGAQMQVKKVLDSISGGALAALGAIGLGPKPTPPTTQFQQQMSGPSLNSTGGTGVPGGTGGATIINASPGQQVYLVVAPMGSLTSADQNAQVASNQLIPINSYQIPQVNLNVLPQQIPNTNNNPQPKTPQTGSQTQNRQNLATPPSTENIDDEDEDEYEDSY